jgi:hypothetical protein
VTKVIVNDSLGLKRFGRNGIFARSIYALRPTVIAIAFFVALFGSFAFAQDKPALTLNQVSDLVKQGISSNRIVQLVEQYGVGFELNESAARRLRQDGADEVVLSAVKRMSARYAEEQQRRKRPEAEDAKRREQEEAQRRAERKRLEEARQEQPKQREVEKKGTKKQEDPPQGVEDIRKRLQEEARRKEEERRIKEEQKRQATAADKATQEAARKSEEPRVILPFDKTTSPQQEEAKQRPQKEPNPSLRTPEEADRVARLRNVTSTPEGEVSGEIVNNSNHTVRDVQLQILYSWRWKNETRPGKDDPGTVNYHILNQEIPAGKTTRFNYKPAPPLPSRTDGQFDVTVKIIGFAEVIPGVRK